MERKGKIDLVQLCYYYKRLPRNTFSVYKIIYQDWKDAALMQKKQLAQDSFLDFTILGLTSIAWLGEEYCLERAGSVLSQ